MKNSDSDYKAEDEGSASDSQTKKKFPKKIPFSLKMTKKQIIEKAIKNFIPEDVKLVPDQELNQQLYKQLAQLKQAKEFSLNFKIFIGKVIHVTDGDTVKIAILLNGKFTRFTFRLDGIDTAQTRRGQVKEFGKQVKEIIKEMLFQKMVRVEAGKFDKYGRVLCRIYAFSQGKQFCVNDFLIENDMAKSYQGKTKNEFTKKDYQLWKQKYDQQTWPIVTDYPFKNWKK